MTKKQTSLPLPGLRWRGLTLKLFVWIVLPIILILLVATFGSFALHQDEMREMVGMLDARAVRTAAGVYTTQLESRAAAINNLAMRAADGYAFHHLLASSAALDANFNGGLAFFTTDGQLVASDAVEKFQAFLENPSFIQFISSASAEPVFSPVFTDTKTEKKLIFIAVQQPNTPIIVGGFDPAQLAQDTFSAAFDPSAETAICLFDQNGAIIFASHEENKNIVEGLTLHPGVEAALRGESSALYEDNADGEHVIAYTSVAPLGWALVIEEPWKAVATPALLTTLLTPLTLVPVLLLSIAALWFGARQIIQPLQNLENRARDLAWGNFSTIQNSVGGIDEIARLQNTLIYLSEKVRTSQQGLRSYIGAITTGQEEERRRLARELHDETIQDLIALNQRMHLIQRKNTDVDVADRLNELQTLTQDSIRDLRRVTHALRPLYLDDLGLVAALDMLARETQESTALPVSFQRVGQEQRLSPETELALYRMAQEGLSNIIRHAQASKAALSLVFADEQISLTVSDDGTGFEVPESPAEFAPGGHFGLLGLYERAELIAATLNIRSTPYKGTDILITLPVNE
jgi:two-component system sensor histidine kinase UhpB